VGCEADHSSTSSAEVKNACSYTSSPPYVFMACYFVKHRDCMADVLMGFHRFTFSKPNIEFNSNLSPCNFWAFPTMKKELRNKKFPSDQRSAAHFREMGGAL
jgi:hypothetical protein